MIRSLYSARPHPYYIVAPDYRRNSAGIRVMHMLCDALNRSGYDAYIATSVLNPELITPHLNANVVALHKEQGLEPICVYPEVVSGNPLAGDVVARYLLNTPGFLRGGKDFVEDDIFFCFAKGLLLPGMPEDNVLFLQPTDLRIFRPPADPAKRIPGKVCYYRGRKEVGIDKSLLPADAIEITSTYPGSWEELVDTFQTSEFFYSSSTTALSAEAALCGCVGVVIPGEGAPSNFSLEETGNYGVAWGLEPQEIERARRTLPLLRELLEKQEQEFWPALDRFIDVTQKAAGRSKARKQEQSIARRLENRDLSARRFVLESTPASAALAPVGVVILDTQGADDRLARTLHSLDACVSLGTPIRPLLLSNEDLREHGQSTLVDAINRVVAQSDCEWFLVLQAGEEFTASALLLTALELAASRGDRAVYADEITRTEVGSLESALRPDINLDLLLGYPAAFARHWLFRRDLWQELGGFAPDYTDAFELHYILRLIESGGLQGLGHVSEPLVISEVPTLRDSPQERQVIEHHLQARGYEQAQVGSRQPGCYDVSYSHQAQPLVSIVVVVDERLLQAQRCIDSLLENTTYGHYEVLLLDRSDQDPSVNDWLMGIEQLGVDQLRVLRIADAVSEEAIRNHGAFEARGEVLLFLDTSIGIIGNDWLQQLLNHSLRPEVGCVGAKLIGGDGKIRHAGLLLGLDAPVSTAFAGSAANAAGYMQRLQLDQGYAALGGQCLMLRRDLFIAAGGFDDQFSPWSSTDLCLKLTQAGYANVWTPRVQLLISDSQASPVTAEQEDRMYERWLPVLAQDPAYNPNLSLAAGGAFKLADTAWSGSPITAQSALPKVLVHPAKQGDGAQTRIILPFNALREAGLTNGVITPELLSVAELQRYDPDVILLQRQFSDQHLESMRRMKAFSRAFKVYDLDEYLTDTPVSALYRQSHDAGLLDSLRRGLSYVDRLLVPSQMMAQVCEGFSADVQITRTCLDPRWRGLSSQRRSSSKPRVGWVEDTRHPGGINVIADVVKELTGQVEWVFLGKCPEALRAFVHEVHAPEPMESYPARLASLNLDLVLEPLENTLFNRCRSNVRLLEFGACGLPVICSDLEYCQGDLPVLRVKDSGWVEAIRAVLSDLDAAHQMGDALRQQVLHNWMLEGENLKAWHAAWLPGVQAQ